MFEVRSVNAVNTVPYNGSSPSTDILDAAHNDTTFPTILEPLQHPQAKAAPQVISDIAAPSPKPFTAPPDPYTYPPSMRNRGRQRTVSSRMKESIEAGEFKISIFNVSQSTYETQHDIDLELQDIMSNSVAFLA